MQELRIEWKDSGGIWYALRSRVQRWRVGYMRGPPQYLGMHDTMDMDPAGEERGRIMEDQAGPLLRKPIYQLKITLDEIEPEIWRRVLVSGNVNMSTVHKIIQVAMGWTNSHLHMFTLTSGQILSDPRFKLDFLPPPTVERSRNLRTAAAEIGSHFTYEYDFGDGWTHEVLVEDILPPGPSGRVPRCIAGENQCPPENCGGPRGYSTLLHTMKDPDHPEHKNMVERYGKEFDPRAFDMETVNESLRRLG